MGGDCVRKRVVEALMEGLNRGRRGEIVDPLIFSSLFSMLRELDIYDTEGEAALLSTSSDFFLAECEASLGSMTLPDYCHLVERRIEEVREMLNFLSFHNKIDD